MGTADLKEHINSLKLQLENTDNLGQKDSLERRIAALAGGVAIIKVGAATEAELKYLKQKIEDGVNEAKRALEEGIVVGGDVAFIHAIKDLEPKAGVDEQSIGYNIVLKAVEAPFRQIVTNAGNSPDVMVNWLKNDEASEPNQVYDARINAFTNAYGIGIIDALKVVRTVLENAISGAGMFLSIEATITDEVQDEN